MTWLDTALMTWVAGHRFALGDQLARDALVAGNSRTVLIGVALAGLGYVVVRHRYRLGAGVLLAVVTSGFLAGLLKQVVGRARPPSSLALVHPGGLSMPSTDAALTAAAAVALYLGLARLHVRRRGLTGAVLAASVGALGLLLVYLGVHWPTDVLAGWVLGVVVGAGAAAVAGRPTPLRPARGASRRTFSCHRN